MAAAYKVKEVTIEAISYDGTNGQAFDDWLTPLGYMVQVTGAPNPKVLVGLTKTAMQAKVFLELGYWIVFRSDRETLEYLLNEQFNMRYEPEVPA
jgi:hypothetical protein